MHLRERNWAASQNWSSASDVPNQQLQELIPRSVHVRIPSARAGSVSARETTVKNEMPVYFLPVLIET